MNYTVYKITNNINNKIYIGAHQTKDIDDGYMGSGKLILRAIKKYGKDKFVKKILKNFNNLDEMFEYESRIVNEKFIKSNRTYNITVGGNGGFFHINDNRSEEQRKLASKYANSHENKRFGGKSHSIETMEILDKHLTVQRREIQKKYPKSGFYNEKHSAEVKRKISDIAKKRLKKPENNSQYGTMWITNGIKNKKIKKDSEIPEGFYKGRTIN